MAQQKKKSGGVTTDGLWQQQRLATQKKACEGGKAELRRKAPLPPPLPLLVTDRPYVGPYGAAIGMVQSSGQGSVAIVS